MAKPDWGELQKRFLSEYARTGISPKTWCEAQGLNYTSARRYIKKPTAQSAQKTAQKKLRNEVRTAQLGKSSETSSGKVSGENCELRENDVVQNTKRNSRSGNPSPLNQFQPGNQQALKHGGYARRLLLKDDVTEDARQLSLDDELFRLRAANLTAAENIGRWCTMLEDAENDEARKLLLSNITAAENAMHRNTARIGSLEYQKAAITKMFAESECRREMAAHNKAISSLKVEYQQLMNDRVRVETENLRLATGGHSLSATRYTTEDYLKAQASMEQEFGDLD